MALLVIIFNLSTTLAQETMGDSGNTVNAVAIVISLSACRRGRRRKESEFAELGGMEQAL